MHATLRTVSRHLVGALTAGLMLTSFSASAAPEAIKTQVPGYYRQALGDFTVTALYDGYVDLDPKLLKGMRADKVQSLLARMFIAHSKGVQTAVNAYLVHTGDHLVLVDAGAAKCFGPSLGQIQDNIRAAGYALEDIDTVLLTHLHPDHVCGLLAPDGQPAFPKATVWVAQEDADFWLSEAVAGKAPEGMRPMFKMARDSAAPYLGAAALKTYKAGEIQLPGVTVVPTHGHTPGHSSYLFSSGSQKLLIWGDIVHSHSVQFAHPEVSLEFDNDQPKAIVTRKALFEKAAASGWWIAGAHLPFPGLGHIRHDAKGYAWVPVEFGPLRSDR